MLTLRSRTATAWRSAQRLAAGMATVSDAKIGATKVPMSLLEPNAYINYQRIEDNLAIVRDRCVVFVFTDGGILGNAFSGCSDL